MSRDRKIKIGAAGGALLIVGLLVFVGLGFAQESGPAAPTNWENPFRINRPGIFANPGVEGLIPDREFAAQAAEEYSVTVIEPPQTFDSSRAYGINNAGDVVGRFFNLNETLGAEEDRTAFVWKASSGAQILPTLAGHSSAWDINASGLISGFSFTADIDQHAVRWDSAEGGILDLGTLENSEGAPGRTSNAFGINGPGDVVGLSDIPNLGGDFTPFHAFIYSDESGTLDLGTLTTDYPEWQNGYSIAYAINKSGQAVGIANDAAFLYKPFIFNPSGGMQALNIDPSYPEAEWYAVAINTAGLIGGHVIVAGNQSLPYYWPDSDSDPVPLDMPDGFPYGEIYGINSSGAMVGIMWDTDAAAGAVEHAFIFDTENGVRDLNDLIPADSGWVLYFARDINASGQIVGTGDYMGKRRGFVLTNGAFLDVGQDYWAFDWIEALYASGITSGCTQDPPRFCPEQAITRAQLAVFLERGMRGSAYAPPPATGDRFDDVPGDYWAAAWIEQLAADGITSGCSSAPPLYCPEDSVTRAEMAVFLERAMHWPDRYAPPSATGTLFDDVGSSYWAAAWIEQLYADGVTTGCSASPPLYCPEASVTRAQMAVFLVKAFSIPLP